MNVLDCIEVVDGPEGKYLAVSGKAKMEGFYLVISLKEGQIGMLGCHGIKEEMVIPLPESITYVVDVYKGDTPLFTGEVVFNTTFELKVK